MKIDANVIDRIVAKTIYDVEWWDYIGAEVSDDQWRLMMMGRLAGISEFANALKEVLNADRKDEPQTSCKTCRYGEVDEGYVRCAYYSKSGEQDEPQTDDLQDWKDRMWAEAIVTEPTISKMEQVEVEPQLTPNYCGTCKHRDVPCGDLPCDMCKSYSAYEPKDEPQTERSE